MLEDVVGVLVCPHCGSDLAVADRCLRCLRNHVFDIARQGYVSLLPGPVGAAAGDTAPMVAARADFLSAGHFAPIAHDVADAVAGVRGDRGCVVDVGAGTGYYLAHVLDRMTRHAGLALDVSKYACRRAAKAHPRVGAVVADTWRSLPVRSAAASLVLNVFAPRNAAEMHRILLPGGHLVVVTPNAAHLGALVSRLGLLSVDHRKQDRLQDQLGALFEPLRQQDREFSLSLHRQEAEAVVAMGPSAWHATREAVRGRIAELPDPIAVAASVTVSVYRRR